jgi:putative hydrolase of the HAD superfamily
MIKAILFDFDGVLTTDPTGTISIMNYIKENTTIDCCKFEKCYRAHNWNLLYGVSTHESIWSEVCVCYGRKIDVSILHQSFKATPLDELMFALLKELKLNGYKIGLVTDNKSDRVNMILDQLNLRELFDSVVISADVGSGKKESKIFDTILGDLSLCYNECVFIDNNENNLVIPKERGMQTIHFDHIVRDDRSLRRKLFELINYRGG